MDSLSAAISMRPPSLFGTRCNEDFKLTRGKEVTSLARGQPKTAGNQDRVTYQNGTYLSFGPNVSSRDLTNSC